MSTGTDKSGKPSSQVYDRYRVRRWNTTNLIWEESSSLSRWVIPKMWGVTDQPRHVGACLVSLPDPPLDTRVWWMWCDTVDGQYWICVAEVACCASVTIGSRVVCIVVWWARLYRTNLMIMENQFRSLGPQNNWGEHERVPYGAANAFAVWLSLHNYGTCHSIKLIEQLKS